MAETQLEGAAEQGGLMRGRTDPGSTLSLDGRPVPVAPDGGFVIGFGRDAPAEMRLGVRGPGGVLEIPIAVAPRRWPVQRVDGLPQAKVTPDPKELERIRDENALVAAARRRATARPYHAGGFQAPAEGTVSGVFGSQRVLNGEARAPHSGTDIAAPAGAPVNAAAAGVVSLVHPDMFFTGKTVMIDHGQGLSSIYAHLSDIVVAAGQSVARGERIGSVGASGRATGPHLHWGVSWFEEKLDPETVLKVYRP